MTCDLGNGSRAFFNGRTGKHEAWMFQHEPSGWWFVASKNTAYSFKQKNKADFVYDRIVEEIARKQESEVHGDE